MQCYPVVITFDVSLSRTKHDFDIISDQYMYNRLYFSINGIWVRLLIKKSNAMNTILYNSEQKAVTQVCIIGNPIS